MSPIIIAAAVGLVGLYLLNWVSTRKLRATLPPGPPRKPVVGNLGDLPSHTDKAWEYWLKHKELYGPISSLTVCGQNVIIINDARIAVELLEKHSLAHSSRPHATFAEMAGWDDILGSVQYGEHFRAVRRALHQEIGSKVSVARFNHIQEVEARRFLFRVLNDPESLVHHIRKEVGAIVLKLGYGYTIEPHKRDPLVDLADRAMEEFSLSILAATWAVDFLPFLKYLPAWLPGAEFKRMASSFKKTVTAFSDLPYAFTKHQMTQPSHVPSFLSHQLQKGVPKPQSPEERVAKWSTASLYAGGADTTVSTMAAWFIAMALFPDVQRKAQEEIDRVTGGNRLPDYQDRENLPYINAMIKESVRWHSVVPMNVAHVSIQDDSAGGYTIPKGSQIMTNLCGLTNSRAFTHDPNIYSDPMTFKPERFIDTATHKAERDPYYYSFGFGRRVCPGRTLADSNIYISMALKLRSSWTRNRDSSVIQLRLSLTSSRGAR
ncbi:cytochrome P450 [Aspergillus floccosus]